MARMLLLATAGLTALALGSAALAQQPPAGEATPGQVSRSTSYDAAFFAPYAPRTALDIAQRVPGFQLDLGDSDVRGFAQAAGNVVINGARPSSKADTLETTLLRIPAQRVVRVEVAPGDLYGSDYAGRSQVLNVVLSAAGGFDANITAAAQRRYSGYINTDIQGSTLFRRGPSTFNLSAGTGRNKQYEEGTDTLVDVGSGDLFEHRRKFNSYFNRDPFLAGSWALERSANKAIRVNARWQPSRFDLFQRNRVRPADGDPHDDNLIQRYRNPVIELGGDVTRPLLGGAVKLVGLATRRKRNDRDTYIARDGLIDEGGQEVGGSEQVVKAKRNETIGRINWTRADLWGLSFEAGGEGVLNTLDSDVSLSVFDEDGTHIPIDLPIEQAKVKEKRGEVFFRAGKSLSKTLRVDGGLNYEFSHLTVSGDALADRRLKFLKPNVSVDWQPGGGWRTRFSVRRTVAQLDFYDFISVAELSTDRINGGNENLEPQRAWEFRFTAERPLLGEGVVKLDLGHDRIQMLQDRILIFDDEGNGFDAPGNLGTGKRSFATLTVDAPLGRALKGLRLKFEGTIQRTRVEDPISGKQRNFSDFFPDWEWRVDLRRDIGNWSYGVVVNDRDRFTFFRTDEFDVNFNGGPYGTLFVERRLSPRTALRFDIDNLFDTSGNRHRLRFFPNRALPEDVIDEYRERNRHMSFGLTLKQSFGGGSGGSAPASAQ